MRVSSVLSRQVGFTEPNVGCTVRDVKSRIKEKRLEAGLSQQALAQALGVSRQTVNALETGRYDPSLVLAVRLARYFGSTVEDMFDVDA